MALEPKKASVEEKYRGSVKDALVVLRILATFCTAIDEAVGMAELALENDGQLKMLIAGIQNMEKETE